MKRKKKSSLPSKISTDFSEFQESLNYMIDGEGKYRKLTLSQEIQQEVIHDCVIKIVGADPKDSSWGFVDINGQVFEYKGIVGSPFYGDIPKREVIGDPSKSNISCKYYNYYKGSIKLEGRYLNYGKSWGPLASYSESYALDENGKIIGCLGRVVS